MIEQLLQKAVQVGRPFIEKGAVATYIPELGNADKNKLGVLPAAMFTTGSAFRVFPR